MKVSFSSILIGVNDLTRAKTFYENLLNITFDEFRPSFARFTLDGVEFNVETDADDRAANWKQMYVGGRKPFSFLTDDLEALLTKVKSIGGTIVQQMETKPWGYKETVIADPDGNEFIVEQEIK